MGKQGVWVTGLVIALLAATPAVARSGHTITITATGTGIGHVHPKNRKSNRSIAAAVEQAKKNANQRAFKEARAYAHAYAKAAGRKIVRLMSVSDAQSNPFYGPGEFIGPFGPNKYCGKVRVRVGKFVKGQRPKFKTVRRCFVPSFESRTLTLTYLAR